VPVRDYYNETRWVRAVKEGVDAVVHTLQAATASNATTTPAAPATIPCSMALVGHFKDASSYYLRAFAPWTLLDLPRQGEIDATAVRAAYWGAKADRAASDCNSALQVALAPVAPLLPASTIDFLQTFAYEPAYPAMQAEWRMVQGYRAAWASAPYPPVFVTVDALLRCNDHVLLIRRAHSPGKGLLALPGGFIEQRETLWQSCLRELIEETHCDTPHEVLAHALQSSAVFDHPDRSQRGRTITHAFYIDLGHTALPTVQADDDAQEVLWVPVEQLLSHESDLFEDHFHILDHFLNLTATA
jgi:bifunctional NMN adenylyltransferase/nudix hydrolase